MICLKNEIILPEAVVFDDSGKINQQASGEGGRSLILSTDCSFGTTYI
jgi:hypothetical protein